MKGFRKLGEPLFSQGLTARLWLGARVTAGVSSFSISGTVYDADGTTPVSGATIALGAYTAISAANGTYTITDIPPNTSGSMTCTKTGYSWTAISVSAMAANLTNQNYTNAWWAAGGVAGSVAAVYQFKGAASQAAAYLRVAGSAGNASLDPAIVGGTAPAWNTTDGFVFTAASSHYLKSGVLPGSGWSIVVRFSNVSNNGYLFGSYTLTPGYAVFSVAPYSTPNELRYDRGTQVLITNPGLASGVIGIAAADPYRNGVDEGTLTAWASADPTNRELYLGAMNPDNGAANTFLTGKIQAIAFYNTTLNATQMGGLSSAINF